VLVGLQNRLRQLNPIKAQFSQIENSDEGVDHANRIAPVVQKHLEHIFQRLGVETRTAAAVCALSAGDAHPVA
jgi:hypothetical protein